MEMLFNNMATVVVGMLVFTGIGLAVFKIVRDKKKHKCSCACGGCSQAGACRRV